MKQSVSPMRFPCLRNINPGRSARLAIGTLVLAALSACASVTSNPAEPGPLVNQVPETGLASVSVNYSTGDYAGSMAGFDSIIASAHSDANSRRLAHLGKALIYLGSDTNWHSIDNARIALKAAGSVVPGSGEEFTIETDMLMDSVAAQIGSESNYLEMKSKAGTARAEITRLQKERDALVQERDGLLKEQQALNEALEKLKNLTLGN